MSEIGPDLRRLLDAHPGALESAARALGAAEPRLRGLVDRIPDAVAVGRRGRFLYANRALLELLGHDRLEQLTERPLTRYLCKEAIGRVEAAIQLARAGQVPSPLEVEVTRGGGEVLQVELLVRAVHWDGEDLTLGIARDLTERRRLQARLVDADALAAVGTLAAGIAHEINNPLAYVMLNLEYMMRELPRQREEPELASRLDARLTDAEHGAWRVGAIVRDLHSFAMREAASSELVDVRVVVERALQMTRQHIDPRAQLVARLDEASLLVRGDPGQLEQVFVNLLVNAAQAIGTGARDRNTVTVSIEREGDQVLVSVGDSGAGIAQDRLGRVFEPFFTTKPAGIGTGLGLSVCHRIVSDLGGKVSVDSEVGRGTTFRVSLPYAGEGEGAPRRLPSPAPRAPLSRRGRVLVIDDEPLVAEMLGRILQDRHEVTRALGGLEALRLIEEAPESYDVVLCDLLMPEMDGVALYEALGERNPGMRERFVFMTAGAFTRRAAEFLAKVPNERLAKPFDLGEVERLVAEVAARPRAGGGSAPDEAPG